VAGTGNGHEAERKIDADEAARKAMVLAESLSQSMDKISKSLANLKKTKASRRLVVSLVISIILDVALTIGLTYNSVQEAGTQKSVQQVNLTQCDQSNTDRQEDKLVWDTFINDIVPPGTKISKTAADDIKKLRSLISQKDTLRDCKDLYG
jgi:hypothetical protein